jgi:hypothetical protein
VAIDNLKRWKKKKREGGKRVLGIKKGTAIS